MSPTLIDQIAERTERLLVRHDELQRTNTILREQISALTHERDSLKSRLVAARARVDTLIDRLPGNHHQDKSNPDTDSVPSHEEATS
jgi:cell division septum initiation protein DivIVA